MSPQRKFWWGGWLTWVTVAMIAVIVLDASPFAVVLAGVGGAVATLLWRESDAYKARPYRWGCPHCSCYVSGNSPGFIAWWSTEHVRDAHPEHAE